MAYLHPDKLAAVDRILLRKKVRQGVRQAAKPKTRTQEQLAAGLYGKATRRATPRTESLISRLAARL